MEGCTELYTFEASSISAIVYVARLGKKQDFPPELATVFARKITHSSVTLPCDYVPYK